MAKDDWVLFFAEAVKRQQRQTATHPGGPVRSDQDLVLDARDSALADGACERRAWNAAVGAYLQRHPETSLFKAERMVSCLIRPCETGDQLSAPSPTPRPDGAAD